MRSRLGTTVEQRFKSDERVKVAVINHPNSEDHTIYPRMMFMQTNGVLAPGNVYDLTDTFNIGSSESSDTYGNIFVGDSLSRAGIKIYYLRIYNTTITQW